MYCKHQKLLAEHRGYSKAHKLKIKVVQTGGESVICEEERTSPHHLKQCPTKTPSS